MQTPLAVTLRPQTIDDIVGQDHLLGPGKIIRRMVEAKRISSMILYGQPGIGKSTIAYAIANSLNLPFVKFNAATDTKKDLQAAIKKADQSTIVLLVDEIHRLTKPLQDFLLPYTENGNVIMIGSTTQNPYIEIAPAIRSRAQIFELKPVTKEALSQVLAKAIQYLESQQKCDINIEPEAVNLLVTSTNGDVRTMLTAFETAVLSTQPINQLITINTKIIEEVTQHKAIAGDKTGDAHYDILSALQKSVRGSDTDAALHYAARLIEINDLQSLVRRLTVMAYEDVGLADPTAVTNAVTAINTAMNIGFPEARIPLAQAIILLSTAPKSNSGYNAINEALQDVQSGQYSEIPNTLKDAHYSGAHKLNHGTGYNYAHDYPHDWVAQQYLPDSLWQIDKHYFISKNNSATEKQLGATYINLKKAQRQQLKKED